MSDICHHRLYDVSVLISSRLDILKLVTILLLGLYFPVRNRYFKFHQMKKSIWRDLPKSSTQQSLKTNCETNRNPQAEFRHFTLKYLDIYPGFMA